MNKSLTVNEIAIQSGKWAFVARVSQILGGFLIFVIFPFWLLPEDMGIISMFSSVLALVLNFQQAGLMEAIVQREQDSEKIRNIAFWLSIFISLILFLIVYLSAPMIAMFFNNDRLAPALRVASFQIILIGFSNIPLAWLQRNFQFRSCAVIHLSNSIVMIIVSIWFAINGAGYWAYVAGLISGGIIRMVLSIFYMDWKPRVQFEFHLYAHVLKFSSFVLLELILAWLLVWFDKVVVAKNLGSDAAGIYTLAFNLTMMAISLPCSAITGITLSTFSRMQNDLKLLRSSYLSGTGLIASFAIPAGIGLALLGPTLVGIIYPGRWNGLGAIFPILGLYAGFGHLWVLNTDAFKAIGKPEIMVKIYVPTLIIMLPAYWWSSFLGLFEFSIVRSLIVLVSLFPHTYYAVRHLGLQKDYLVRLIRSPIIASAIMTLCVWAGLKSFSYIPFPSSGLHLLSIIAIIVLGIAVYWITLCRIDPNLSKQITDILSQSIKIVHPNEKNT